VPAINNASHPMQNFPADFYLGADPNHNGRRFKGWMDEVCIWNRALSRDEIRMLRHLVKSPQDDPALILYFQFNEANGDVLDRTGLRHARLGGASVRTTSTCPVGAGNASKKVVQTPGTYLMDNTGLSLVFPAGGILPNGEFFATRIHYTPDQMPADAPHAPAYWIINNYGTNSGFSPLDSTVFARIGTITAVDASNPTAFQLYQRPDNADGLSWQLLGPAQSLVPGADGSAIFNANVGIFQSGQLFISKNGAVVKAKEEVLMPYPFAVFPNPLGAGQDLMLQTQHQDVYEMVIFNAEGLRVWQGQGQGNMRIQLPELPAGIYVYRINTSTGRFYGKVVRAD
jgi:hypothetical protein